MSDFLAPSRQEHLLSDLLRISTQRAEAEANTTARLTQAERELESAYQEERSRLEFERDAERERCEREFSSAVEEAQDRCAQEIAAAEADHETVSEDVKSRFQRASETAAEEFQDEKWHASAMFDAEKNSLGGELTPRLSFITERANKLSELQQENARWRKQLKLTEPTPRPQFAVAREIDPLPLLENATVAATSAADELRSHRRRPLLKALWLVPVFLAVFVVLMLFGGVKYKIEVLSPAVLQGQGLEWLLTSAGITLAFAILMYVGRHFFRRHSARQMSRQLSAILAEADIVRQECEQRESVVEERRLQQSKQRMKEQKEQLKGQYEQKAIDLARQGDRELREAEKARERRVEAAHRQCEQTLAQLNEQYGPTLHGQENRFSKALLARELKYRRERAAFEEDRDQTWRELNATWRDWMTRLKGEVNQINTAAAERFPAWQGTDWPKWQPPHTVPGGLRFGHLCVDLSKIEGGVPKDERLRRLTEFTGVPSAVPADEPRAPAAKEEPAPPTALAAPMAIAVPPPCFTLPAVTAFPSFPSLLYKSYGSGRTKAVEALQAAMLRALTALPAGKVRFTIIDPLGLGENFAGFMHLADYDEQLVTSRIWTEQEHIQQRLADLTEHLENVIQTYLRNEFETIEEYNEYAGEVAEPFRILVVADFPANFNEAAFRRLVSIAQTGPRCGVFPLITVDAKKPVPHGCDLKDLERHCNVIKWTGDNFIWLSEAFRDYPLTLDSPPPADEFSKIVHTVGKHAKDAGRVEVPFRYIAATGDEMWTGDCGKELDAPLGRAGATKLQHMKLGLGTSQHVVIAGKTGSGKSTLLHVLITSMALRYSPDQVQFYLVDFKKGVEFKTYATHKLPHARVVAVESEREFGLSVLERLDVELKSRGDAFRGLGVQDLNAYRKQTGRPLPRILLLIDEFQELFVEDDRVGTQSALLLDRLVRQGRAFGIHVLLGSQTLGGAYSLARSTLGQMAVRIALECSEADASMILSEGNTAARLLSRPGEAIYNDANGRVEGNKPFQVAWLADEDREKFLASVRDLAARREYPVEPQIVFEGNAPADLAGNHLLAALLQAEAWPERRHAVTAWLGDPVAIKEPTAAVFRRQGGSNLLIVGQREEGALGILAAALVSLAAQHRPEDEAGGRDAGKEVVCATGGLSASAVSREIDTDDEERAFAAEFGLEGVARTESSKGVSSNGSSQAFTPFEDSGRATLEVCIDPDPAAARFYILDGTRGDSPQAGLFERLAEALPHQVRVAGWRDVPAVLAEIDAIVQRRTADNSADGAAVYLVIANLGRFRELRRDEGDFGYGGFGDDKKAKSPAQQLLNILKEGAGLGVHVLCWSDTAGSLNRAFDRQTLREFELRVLFQMGSDDSSNLIDDPAANKLGQFRALFYSEEDGHLEKFRPYDVPGEEWLDVVAEQLIRRQVAAAGI